MVTTDPPTGTPNDGRRRLTFRTRDRLGRAADYRAAFDARCRATIGPMTIHARANGLGHARLGLSIGRRFGNAVRRNAFKRRVREAFRKRRAALPAMDIVVTARAHELEPSSRYETWLEDMARQAARRWAKRSAPSGSRGRRHAG